MRKVILACGLIGGSIVALVLVYSTVSCYSTSQFEGNMLLGYTAMLLAFSLVFVGVKTVRDKHNEGIISFGKAFKTGLFITLITSTIYVAVWLVCYYLFIPDFMEKYTAFVLKQAAEEGNNSAEIAKKTADMQSYTDMYKNPAFVILLTYAEILPVGLVVSLITALLLKRSRKEPGAYSVAGS